MFSLNGVYECATWSTILREEQYIFILYNSRSQNPETRKKGKLKRGTKELHRL